MEDMQQANNDTSQWARTALIGAVLLACGVALSPNMVDTDIWGHVQFGQDLLAGKGLPRTTEYSFTAEGYPWINHELASELMLAGLVKLGGGVALLVTKCLLGLVVVGLMLRVGLRRGVRLTTMAALVLLVSVNLTYHWATRPQVFSYTYFAILLVVLERAFAQWNTDRNCRTGWLWLMPPLIVVWTNTHGAFVAGVGIVGAYLFGRIVETIVRAYRDAASWSQPRVSTRSRWVLVNLSLVGIATLAATLINPYGYHLPWWLVQSLGKPRPEIAEWAAMSVDSVMFWPFALIVGLTLFALIGTRERRDWTQVAILVLCGWQACRHGRHVPFFAIAVGFWIGPHIESSLARLRRTAAPADISLPVSRWARGALVTSLLGVYLLLGSRLYERLHRYPVEKAQWPVDAFQYMADHELGGRLVVAFDWAQYAIAAFHEERPDVPQAVVAMDGRFRTCYPQDIIDMHFDFFGGAWPAESRYRDAQSGPIDPAHTLEHERPNLVLMATRNMFARSVVEEQRKWVLLYQDGLAQLWGRADVYDDPTSAAYLPSHARAISDQVPQGSVSWPALPMARAKRTQLLTAASSQSRKNHGSD